MNRQTAITQTGDKLTIAGCLETILEYVDSQGPCICDDDDEEPYFPQEAYDYIKDKLGLEPAQAELFAAIMELGISGDASADNVARKLNCSNLKFISLRPEIDKLIAMRYVRSSTHGFRGVTYRVPDEAIKAIQKNEKPSGDDISNLSTTGMVRRMNGLFREFWRDSIDLETLTMECMDILRYNTENTFVKEYIRLGINDMCMSEQLLFLYMTVRRTAFQESSFGWEDYGKLFVDILDEDYMRSGIENGTIALIEQGIVEHDNNNGIVDNSRVVFVEDVINKVLGDMCTGPTPTSSCRNLIGCSTINGKQMYYNSEEKKQIDTLSSLLQQENFANVVARLKEKGFRSGFSCLFFGPAGTGKTESVYQIARQTGRDIFLVDVSQLKSKWVGDSEKNVHALFQEYRRLVKSCDVAPILLFNEADAIFGVRKKGAEESVDKMNNAIQNIILQEMENLEGILIATTNLTQNFDQAFERRFIYKIHFQKPDTNARTLIWESLVDGLEHQGAEVLARDFEFSGGQIENISRKATVDYILSGVQPGVEGLRELCENETITGKKADRPRIGF